MLIYTLRRLGSAIPTVFIIITLTFFMIRMAPGGPFDLERPIDPLIMANLNRAYNLDAPLWSQYLTYLGNLAQGDLGPSFTKRDFTVNDLFAVGLPVSVLLGSLALLVAVILGTLLGTMAALRQNSGLDYAVVGLAVAYGVYRKGRLQLISAAFEPLLGNRAHGPAGKVIDMLAIFATLFGSAASLGLGALQIRSGLEIVAGIGQVGNAVLIGIIAVLTAAFILSAVSGVARGIQWLSNINIVLAIGLALFVFVVGPTVWEKVLGNPAGSAPFPYDNPALFSMAIAFVGIWLFSVLDRSKTARDEAAAFEAQYIRSETGLGAAGAASH